MRASLRSLRLREADRAPANAGARLRLGGMCGAVASCRSGSSCRSELVRRGCAGRNPSRTPPRRFGRALEPLRRRPPLQRRSGLALGATIFALAPRSGAAPPSRRRSGLALEPPPLRRRPDLALELCLRDGVSASLRCRVPCDSVSTPPWGPRPSLWRRAPALYPPLGTTTLALGATTLAGGTTLALGATTLALASRPRFWAVFPPRCRDPRRPGGHDLCPGAVPPALGTTAFALGRAPALCPRSGGARCEKPSLLVAGGQNGRFFAVSEVGNGRFCRLFAYGLSDSANNRAF